jgi:hypothetical protein
VRSPHLFSASWFKAFLLLVFFLGIDPVAEASVIKASLNEGKHDVISEQSFTAEEGILATPIKLLEVRNSFRESSPKSADDSVIRSVLVCNTDHSRFGNYSLHLNRTILSIPVFLKLRKILV